MILTQRVIEQFHTIYLFKRANNSEYIGGLDIHGKFHWMVSISVLTAWVNDGGFVMDDTSREYSFPEFLKIVEACFQIVHHDDSHMLDIDDEDQEPEVHPEDHWQPKYQA